MINKKTVLVLGAGASKPYGLPLGSELRDSIIRSKNDLLSYFYRQSFGVKFTIDQFSEFCKSLAQSGFTSVDAFLEENETWLETGKAAIALSLLTAEEKIQKNLFPPNQPKDHWYETLWSHLKTPSWEEFKKNQIAIITFNYDRSLEHYLVTILCNQYKINPKVAADGLKSLPVLHVHGDLGSYINNKKITDFGLGVTSSIFNNAKSGIQIVHENNGDTKEFLEAKKLIGAADKLLFIGFGFNPKNMAKLGIQIEGNYRIKKPFMYGTHKGIKTRPWDNICSEYGFSYEAVKLGAGSISDLLNELIN